jgi:hypothetical protein
MYRDSYNVLARAVHQCGGCYVFYIYIILFTREKSAGHAVGHLGDKKDSEAIFGRDSARLPFGQGEEG